MLDGDEIKKSILHKGQICLKKINCLFRDQFREKSIAETH